MIYLDNAATTRPLDIVVEKMAEMCRLYYNPSAAYAQALEAADALEQARKALARIFPCAPEEVVFTSGGTECNNLAIMGTVFSLRGKKRHFITSIVEHPAVFRVFQRVEEMGHEVTVLPVGRDGCVCPRDLCAAIRPDTVLCSVMHVNNELGSVNDIGLLARAAKDCKGDILFHSDGVQAFGKLEVPQQVDLYSTSAHKLHGPKGVGALMIRKGARLSPLNIGGGQEGGLRSGTENLAGICGFAAAAQYYDENREAILCAMARCKAALARELLKIPGVRINGPEVEEGAPYILSVAFEGVKGEMLLHMLEQQEILVSTGSACSARRNRKNRVLQAIDPSGKQNEGTIRFSFSQENTQEEMAVVAQAAEDALQRIRRIGRRN